MQSLSATSPVGGGVVANGAQVNSTLVMQSKQLFAQVGAHRHLHDSGCCSMLLTLALVVLVLPLLLQARSRLGKPQFDQFLGTIRGLNDKAISQSDALDR